VQDYERFIKNLKELVDKEETDELIKELNEGGSTGREIDIEQLLLELEKVGSEIKEAQRFKV
jgi:hypothetical protein